ncbi:hypothetical protein HELRODRAFT_145703, partial [Helobdella robusta]|uniref:Uncharacterized protein n=1 Tax=Helobdella robusta TaxID=6412 RepID=T1EJM2_HELRO
RKNGAAKPVRHRWVFGGIDQDTNDAFLVEVEKRDAATLLPLIQRHILPAYNAIGNIGYQHDTVNHSWTFKPPSGVHTNNVENLW